MCVCVCVVCVCGACGVHASVCGACVVRVVCVRVRVVCVCVYACAHVKGQFVFKPNHYITEPVGSHINEEDSPLLP